MKAIDESDVEERLMSMLDAFGSEVLEAARARVVALDGDSTISASDIVLAGVVLDSGWAELLGSASDEPGALLQEAKVAYDQRASRERSASLDPFRMEPELVGAIDRFTAPLLAGRRERGEESEFVLPGKALLRIALEEVAAQGSARLESFGLTPDRISSALRKWDDGIEHVEDDRTSSSEAVPRDATRVGDPDDVLQQARSITLEVRRNGVPAGHAVVIAPGRAVTAAHVVPGHENDAAAITVVFPNGESADVAVAFREVDLDYALLRFEAAPDLEFETRWCENPAPGAMSWNASITTSSDLGDGGAASRTTRDVGGNLERVEVRDGRILYALGPVEVGPGASGTPIVDDSGALLGILVGGTSGLDDAYAVPMNLVSWDVRVDEKRGRERPPKEGRWVAVGGAREPTNETRAIAHGVAQLLHREGFGLVTGGQDGSDVEVLRWLLELSVRDNRPPSVRVVVGLSEPNDLFSRFSATHWDRSDRTQPRTWVEAFVRQSQFVVALGGGEAVRAVLEQAERDGVPHVAPPAAFQNDTTLHEAASQAIRRMRADRTIVTTYEEIGRADATETAPLVGRVLRRLFGRDGPVLPSADSFHLRSDTAAGEDLLNFTDTARRFAQVMMSNRVQPPLAIGLFGPWGSGKSHFMSLLREECDELARDPRDVFWPRVAAIEFNAWHYMDQSLWASLASQIFDGITDFLVRADPGRHERRTRLTFAEVRQGLTRRLRSTLEAHAEARTAERRAEEDLVEARERVEAARRELDLRTANIASLSQRLWQETRAVLSEERCEAAKNAAFSILDALGSKQDPEEVVELLSRPSADLDALIRDARSTYVSIQSVMSSRVGIVSLFLIGAGLFFIAVVPQTQVWSQFVPFVSSIGGIATILRQQQSRLANVSALASHASELSTLGESIHARARKAIEDEAIAQRDTETAEAVEELRSAENNLAMCSQTVDRIEKSLSEVRAELEQLQAGTAVYEFARERVESDGGYRGQEGIVATIRRDLEDLTRLLGAWVEESPYGRGEEAHWAPLEDVDEEMISLWHGNERREIEERLPIQRIILYIDDLDRCPRERVVEVLQAVHLLLTFELFVVVVGVDARWLERSLASEYGELLGERLDENGNAIGSVQLSSARPHDYLEKIFQIPFTLPNLEGAGFRALIKDQLPTREEALARARAGDAGGRSNGGRATVDSGEPGAPARAPSSDSEVVTNASESISSDPTEAAETATRLESATERSTNEDDDSGSPDTETDSDGSDAGWRRSESTGESHVEREPGSSKQPHAEDSGSHASEPSAERLFFVEHWERDHLASLERFMETPRAVKRFTNIYRLVRLTAIQPEQSAEIDRVLLDDFVGRSASDKTARFRVVALLLALNVGVPHFGARLIRRILDLSTSGPGGRPDEFAAQIKTLRDVAKTLSNDTQASDGYFLAPPSSRSLRREFERERARAITLLEAADASEQDVEIDELSEWLKIVGRYSMYWREQ